MYALVLVGLVVPPLAPWALFLCFLALGALLAQANAWLGWGLLFRRRRARRRAEAMREPWQG